MIKKKWKKAKIKIKKKKEHKSKEDKNVDEIEIQFQIGEKDNYIIKFNVEDKLFYFDIDLKKGNKFLTNIAKEIIEQNIINYFQKLEIFISALKENKEEAKIDTLYDEAITLYSKKKGFYLLISLFINIYEKQNLCPKLIEEFKKMNKEKKNEKNMDRNEDLSSYLSAIIKIANDADTIIKNNKYNPINFYGILLSYLNYYDYENFNKYFKKIYKESNGVLYEILIIYYSNFLNKIIQDATFFEKFIEYAINNKEFDIFENSLNYILDVETFIDVINKKKEIIFKKYGDSNFKTIKIKYNLQINKKGEGKEIDNIIAMIRSIIDFSREKNKLLIYFSSNFWINILKHYNEPNAINIDKCFELRKLYVEYYKLIDKLFKESKKEDEKKMKTDIKKYIDRDEYAFVLDNNIKIFIKNNLNNKNFSDSEILGYFTQYDPYFIEDKYKYKIDTFIFDFIKFDSTDKQFIETFKKLKFEEIFRDNINDFLNKIVSKINSIQKFGIIMDLINVDNIKDRNEDNGRNKRDKEYFLLLKQKYEYIIKKEIETLKEKELPKAIKIIAKFIILLYNKDDKDKTIKFLKESIDKDKKISPLIYNELMINCQDDKYETMKNFIYKKFASNLININNIKKLIDTLKIDENKNKFLRELMEKCKFTKEEFYSNKLNNKIDLLCELFEEGKINSSNREDINFNIIEDVLDKIKVELDGDITKQELEEFLKNDEKVVIKRLKLISFIMHKYDPKQVYVDLKKNIESINKDIKDLTYIKNSLLIFHRNFYLKHINDITDIISDITKKNLKSNKDERTQEKINNLKRMIMLCEQVNQVKDFILFKVIYDEAYGSDQKILFAQAYANLNQIYSDLDGNEGIDIIYKKNKKIFDKIKDILSNNESKADQLIEQIKNHNKGLLKDRTEIINDLTIIFKSKKYEMDLKSIFFFFESINPDDNRWNKNIPKEYETLSNMDLITLKKTLESLKKVNIYNYEEKTNYFKLFTSLYEKKEAIDFLISKIDQNIDYLYDRIEPTNRTISIEKIKDCAECIKIFKKFKEFKNNSDLFEYIKKDINDEKIQLFVSFSKNYSSIIELDRNDNTSFNLFGLIDKIVLNASFIFDQDNEDFCYGENKNDKTEMEELIHLKNRIHIKPQKKKGKTR